MLEQDLRNSQLRAEDANRAKSSFLASMSHEIRTPMIIITGMALPADPQQRRRARDTPALSGYATESAADGEQWLALWAKGRYAFRQPVRLQ